MGGPKRVTLGGYVYHVLNRANGRLRIFKKKEDFAAFEAMLAEGIERVAMRTLRLLHHEQPLAYAALATGGCRCVRLYAMDYAYAHPAIPRLARHGRHRASLSGATEEFPHPGRRALPDGAALHRSQPLACRDSRSAGRLLLVQFRRPQGIGETFRPKRRPAAYSPNLDATGRPQAGRCRPGRNQ